MGTTMAAMIANATLMAQSLAQNDTASGKVFPAACGVHRKPIHVPKMSRRALMVLLLVEIQAAGAHSSPAQTKLAAIQMNVQALEAIPSAPTASLVAKIAVHGLAVLGMDHSAVMLFATQIIRKLHIYLEIGLLVFGSCVIVQAGTHGGSRATGVEMLLTNQCTMIATLYSLVVRGLLIHAFLLKAKASTSLHLGVRKQGEFVSYLIEFDKDIGFEAGESMLSATLEEVNDHSWIHYRFDSLFHGLSLRNASDSTISSLKSKDFVQSVTPVSSCILVPHSASHCSIARIRTWSLTRTSKSTP